MTAIMQCHVSMNFLDQIFDHDHVGFFLPNILNNTNSKMTFLENFKSTRSLRYFEMFHEAAMFTSGREFHHVNRKRPNDAKK